MDFRKWILAASTLLLSVCFIGCAPMSKESYMEQYAEFLDDVSAVYNDCSQKKWTDIEKKYKKFSDEYYKKFEDELTAGDKVVLFGYSAKFNYYKARRSASDVFNGISKIVEDIPVESDDIEQLIDGVSSLVE